MRIDIAMKKLCFLIFTLLGLQSAYAQKNILPKFIQRMVFEKDSSRRSSAIPLPVIGYAQETGVEAGGSVLYSFYSDTLTKGTRVSDIFTYATLTTKGQSRISLGINYWTPQNKHHYAGSISYINFPDNFYGIGSATHKADAERILEKRFRLNLAAEKLFGKTIYLGFLAGGYNYNYSSNNMGIFETDPNVQSPAGGANIYAGPSFAFDNRNNNTYTTHGTRITSSYSFIKGVFGNNNYSGGLLYIEARQYISLSKKLVLGFDAFQKSLIGDMSPFYLMPTLGADDMMRGYYNGRYRDKNYSAAQTELRYRFNDRLGLVAFAGTGTVYPTSLNLNQLKPNYGGGIRYFFDVEKGLSIRLDYGIGEKRPTEERQTGFYVGLGEAF